jgi:hypothetical protein
VPAARSFAGREDANSITRDENTIDAWSAED